MKNKQQQLFRMPAPREFDRGIETIPDYLQAELLTKGISGKGIGYMLGYRSGILPNIWKPTRTWLGGGVQTKRNQVATYSPYLHEYYHKGSVELTGEGGKIGKHSVPVRCQKCGKTKPPFGPVFTEFRKNQKGHTVKCFVLLCRLCWETYEETAEPEASTSQPLD